MRYEHGIQRASVFIIPNKSVYGVGRLDCRNETSRPKRLAIKPTIIIMAIFIIVILLYYDCIA